jgi:hypothetical protein
VTHVVGNINDKEKRVFSDKVYAWLLVDGKSLGQKKKKKRKKKKEERKTIRN